MIDRSTVVNIGQRAMAIAIAAQIYDDTCKEEQRILRELARQQERLQRCRIEKQRYGQMIGVLP
jgi:heme exporter protein D